METNTSTPTHTTLNLPAPIADELRLLRAQLFSVRDQMEPLIELRATLEQQIQQTQLRVDNCRDQINTLLAGRNDLKTKAESLIRRASSSMDVDMNNSKNYGEWDCDVSSGTLTKRPPQPGAPPVAAIVLR